MLTTTISHAGIHLATKDNEYVGTINIRFGDNGGRMYVLHLADRFAARSNIPQDKDWGYQKAAEFAALAAYYETDGNVL